MFPVQVSVDFYAQIDYLPSERNPVYIRFMADLCLENSFGLDTRVAAFVVAEVEAPLPFSAMDLFEKRAKHGGKPQNSRSACCYKDVIAEENSPASPSDNSLN